MSAYALPGCLFPPLGSCSTQTNVCTSKLLHHFSEVVKEKNGSIGHFSLDNVLAMTPSPQDDIHTKEEEKEKCPTEVGIAVKEAKLDPVRLVQAVTKSGSNNDANKRNASSCSPHQDAIQFELSISFNGRSYCATRTLPRLVELRNDLIRELNARRKRLQGRRMRWNAKSSSDNDTVTSIDDEEEEDVDVIIPEIPECNTENVSANGGGVAGRGFAGFAMLQALLGPYCPAIERWLQNVMDLVPPMSSPSLSNFLWEPVSGDISSKCGGSVMRASPSLECIAEDLDSEEEESESEE